MATIYWFHDHMPQMQRSQQISPRQFGGPRIAVEACRTDHPHATLAVFDGREDNRSGGRNPWTGGSGREAIWAWRICPNTGRLVRFGSGTAFP